MICFYYDLHVGSVGGITTKIIAFQDCVISASLPVTGFVVWLGKKRKQSRKRNSSNRLAVATTT